MEKLPKQKSGIMVRKIGRETMLYDTERGMVHILNATAEAVWDSCNGNILLDEMEQRLKNSCTFAKDFDVKEDIKEILSDFSKQDLVCSDR